MMRFCNVMMAATLLQTAAAFAMSPMCAHFPVASSTVASSRSAPPMRQRMLRCVGGADVSMQMSGWASPTWRWGYAVGDAHNEAMRMRTALCDDFESEDVGATRREWLVAMIGDSKTVEWEDVKLVLALKWQKAAREGRDGGDQGFGYVMEKMRLAKYEGSPENDELLVSDLEARLHLIRGDDRELQRVITLAQEGPNIYASLPDANRRAVAARVLCGLDFVGRGL